MSYNSSNNVTFEGYDFTEQFIDKFSETTIRHGLEGGLIGQLLSAKPSAREGSQTYYSFQFLFPDEIFAAAQVACDEENGFVATVNFFAAAELGERPSNMSFDGYAAIAFLRFRFGLFGQSFIERQLSDAEIFVRDGWADAMFVSMIEVEKPKALAA